MIVEYDSKYDEQIKDLLVELQNYLIDIDNWHTQIITPEYREKYFKMDMEKVKNQDGKIYLELENDKVIGLIIGVVEEKDDIDKLTNDCAKTGSVIELIVKNNIRGNGIGKNLLEKLEEYFRNINCKRINIEVFGPNKKGLNFYEKNDYVVRDYIVSKKLQIKEIIMKHSMKLLESPFNRIKNGTKTIEFRIYDEKRRKIKIGDTIEFSLLPDLKEKILTEVIDLYRADTFEELFENLYNDKEEIEKKVKGMYKIYSPEKEKEYGVLGIGIKLA